MGWLPVEEVLARPSVSTNIPELFVTNSVEPPLEGREREHIFEFEFAFPDYTTQKKHSKSQIIKLK